MPDVSELQTAESATLNIIVVVVVVVVVAAEWRGVWQVGRGQ